MVSITGYSTQRVVLKRTYTVEFDKEDFMWPPMGPPPVEVAETLVRKSLENDLGVTLLSPYAKYQVYAGRGKYELKVDVEVKA